MRRFIQALVFAPLVWVLSLPAFAGEFKLKDGRVIKGEPLQTFSNQGVNFKLEDGKYSEKIKWNEFSQEALKELVKIPKAKPFAEVLIDDPEPSPADDAAAEQVRVKKEPPKWSEVERPERPKPNVHLIAGIGTPIGFVAFLLFIAANAYAGMAIALFRNRPVKMVCGISAVAPIVGPVVFLCLPRVPDGPSPEEIAAAEAAEQEAQAEADAQAAQVEVAQQAEAVAQAAVAIPKTVAFRRGEVTFNRKFIESKFAGFFRLIPAEAERDLHLIVRANRGEFTGRRISKATPTDLTFVAQHGEGTTEEVIAYAEIQEICIRHKDAQD